ncbi:MAG TPA: redoxin domain-containing protein [Candidatus Limnocylindrales bacterium]
MLHPSEPHDRNDHREVAGARPSRRPILLGVAIAALLTVAIVVAVDLGFGRGTTVTLGIARGNPAPDVSGMTLDGAPFRLADALGHPVIVNFWGPSCIPCRSEFPLFKTKAAEHAADGLEIVGVLMDDPADPARAFAREFGATWPTVLDPDGKLKAAYRAVARPQSYFIDRKGILRAIQIGEVVAADFERQYATIR